jgi:hypothetical protein
MADKWVGLTAEKLECPLADWKVGRLAVWMDDSMVESRAATKAVKWVENLADSLAEMWDALLVVSKAVLMADLTAASSVVQ